MSHRTQDLEQLEGLAHAIREMRYNEAARQGLAVVLIFVYALTSNPTPLTTGIGLTAAALGTLIRLYASGYVIKNTELAQSGPYAFVRHPLYTGNILLVLGFALANTGIWAIPLALVFFWFYYPPAIEYEDRKLNGIFGDSWSAWASRTPALVPKLTNTGRGQPGRWSLKVSFKKNGEILIVLFVIYCTYLVIASLP